MLFRTVVVLEAAETFPNPARPTQAFLAQVVVCRTLWRAFPSKGTAILEFRAPEGRGQKDSETYPGSRRSSQSPAITYHRVEVWPGKGRVFTHPSIPAADVGGAGPHLSFCLLPDRAL